MYWLYTGRLLTAAGARQQAQTRSIRVLRLIQSAFGTKTVAVTVSGDGQKNLGSPLGYASSRRIEPRFRRKKAEHDMVEARRLLGLAPKTLARYRCKGMGPVFCRFGNRVRYRREDLDD